jgi:hypothetical protein
LQGHSLPATRRISSVTILFFLNNAFSSIVLSYAPAERESTLQNIATTVPQKFHTDWTEMPNISVGLRDDLIHQLTIWVKKPVIKPR